MVSGANGQLGVPAVRPVDRESVPGPGNVILQLLLTAAKPVLDQHLRKRFARINLAILPVRMIQ